MEGKEDLEAICEKAQVSPNHEALVINKLGQFHFRKVRHYLKRENKGSNIVEYLFPRRIDPMGRKNHRPGYPELMLGTYYFIVPREERRHFERLVKRVNRNTYNIKEVGGSIGLMAGLVFAFSIRPRVSYLLLPPVVYAGLAMFLGYTLGRGPGYLFEARAVMAAKELQKEYVSESRYSNKTFDYRIIKDLITT